jgi:glycine/D-amino acid oxidase-like deaminating enzyme
MHVAVLGGGLQGCCAALELASRGARVVLYDREPDILTRTAVANEGKVHLGYMYAADPTLATARTMMTGALAFAPFFRRHLGADGANLATSTPAAYVVHRDSQHDVESVTQYLSAVHAQLAEAAAGRPGAYFDEDVTAPPRHWSSAELEQAFDPAEALAAFSTPEVAVNPVELASLVRARVEADPRIDVRLERLVVGVADEGGRMSVRTEGLDGVAIESFEYVVNALWEGRLAIDKNMGLALARPWLHRLKYGVSFRLPADARVPPSATFISGPFGEVVSYRDGLTYLTWYPTCQHGLSQDIAPPDWATYPDEALSRRIVEGTVTALARIVPALADLDPDALPELVVKGGAIVAWGSTDIYDPGSELHTRYAIGVSSHGRYHTIDPGKLTMAPYFAGVVADRIRPISRQAA